LQFAHHYTEKTLLCVKLTELTNNSPIIIEITMKTRPSSMLCVKLTKITNNSPIIIEIAMKTRPSSMLCVKLTEITNNSPIIIEIAMKTHPSSMLCVKLTEITNNSSSSDLHGDFAIWARKFATLSNWHWYCETCEIGNHRHRVSVISIVRSKTDGTQPGATSLA
jgi:hypothetical protein